MDKPIIMTIYGTRPEAVKVAPLIRALAEDSDLVSSTVVTGQHRDMLDQINAIFNIVPDHDLDVFTPGQGLNPLVSKVFAGLDPILEQVAPDAVVVQGDTSTVAAGAIAAFYREIPVVHLEAGLRSHNLFSPFPEEANRRITGQVASLHLAPTPAARANLIAEGVDEDRIVVTGNTVIDALMYTSAQPHEVANPDVAEALAGDARIILASTHRRENWGEPMARIAGALRRIALDFPDHIMIVPMHANPRVAAALTPELCELANVVLTEPLGYQDFTTVLARSHLVITDSGGVQEEAPALGKPVLVLRENTERPEAVEAGTVQLVGTEPDLIVSSATRLLTDTDHYLSMARAMNPYGDGRAAARGVAAIKYLLGSGREPEGFKMGVDSFRSLVD